MLVWRGRPKTSCCRFILCTMDETLCLDIIYPDVGYFCVPYYIFCCKFQRQFAALSDRCQHTMKCAPLHMQSDYALTRKYTSDAMHKSHSAVFMHPSPIPSPCPDQTSLDHASPNFEKKNPNHSCHTPEIRRADQYSFSSWCLN